MHMDYKMENPHYFSLKMAQESRNSGIRVSPISKGSNYGSIIAKLPPEAKKAIRKRENIAKKLCNAEMSVTFNHTCINENLLPTYTINK